MNGFEIKRAVSATFERIHQFNTDERLENLDVVWHGETAGIVWERRSNPKLFLPAIDERSTFPKAMLHRLLGFVVHELGHLWYTDNQVWDKATGKNPGLLHRLINGLEDPRIEKAVIDSHRAANARPLLENLVQQILSENPDYITADDFDNYPFLLAIEGRRLNGYSIPVPNIIDQSPVAEHLDRALHAAHRATSTAEIVVIAKELHDAIVKAKRRKKPEEPKEPKDPKEGKPGDEKTEGQKGPSDSGEEQGDQPEEESGKGKGGDSNDDSKSNAKKIIEVEPSSHVEESLKQHQFDGGDGYDNRAANSKPIIHEFSF